MSANLSFFAKFRTKCVLKLLSKIPTNTPQVIHVLIFCVEFRELSHLTRDLSQAEKKITVVTSWGTDKMTTSFTQNDNFDHFE